MAEDIVLNAGAGGATLAADEASSISAGLAKYQITKLAFGAKNTRILVENSAGASFPVNIVGTANVAIASQSATLNVVLGAGVANIGLVNSISATVNAVLGAGVTNIGFINNISATVNVSIAAQSATLNVAASLIAGAANIGIVNSISATVNAVLGAGVANIGLINAISATSGVFIHGQSATLNVAASLIAGVANIGLINSISATVNAVLGAGVANIGTVQAISATVNAVLGAGVANIGLINSISATANVIAFGNVAHDGIDSGAPVKIGGIASSNERAAVASLDRVDAWFDLVGRLVVAPWHPNELSGTATTLSATAQTAVVAAPGVGLSLHICSVMCTNKTVTQVRVKLRESAGATGVLKFHGDCASSGGGFVWKPMRPWKLPDNVALGGSISPAASDVAINVEFYTAA